MFCRKCGLKNPDGYLFCRRCGAQLNIQQGAAGADDETGVFSEIAAELFETASRDTKTFDELVAERDAARKKNLALKRKARKLFFKNIASSFRPLAYLAFLAVAGVLVYMGFIAPRLHSIRAGELVNNAEVFRVNADYAEARPLYEEALMLVGESETISRGLTEVYFYIADQMRPEGGLQDRYNITSERINLYQMAAAQARQCTDHREFGKECVDYLRRSNEMALRLEPSLAAMARELGIDAPVKPDRQSEEPSQTED